MFELEEEPGFSRVEVREMLVEDFSEWWWSRRVGGCYRSLRCKAGVLGRKVLDGAFDGV